MRKPSSLALILVVSALVAGCRGTGPDQDSRLTSEIDSVEVLQLESYPVQFVLHVEGWLPNPCTSPEWDIGVNPFGGREIEIELYAVSDGSEACIQVLAPFSVNIPLGGAGSDEVRIILNGEEVRRS